MSELDSSPFLGVLRDQAVDDALRLLEALRLDLSAEAYASAQQRLVLLHDVFTAARAPDLAARVAELQRLPVQLLRQRVDDAASSLAREAEILLYQR